MKTLHKNPLTHKPAVICLCIGLMLLVTALLLSAQDRTSQEHALHPLRLVPQSTFSVNPTQENNLPSTVVVYDVPSNFDNTGKRVEPSGQQFFYLPPFAFIRNEQGKIDVNVEGKRITFRLKSDVSHCRNILADEMNRILRYDGENKLKPHQFRRVQPTFLRIVTDEKYLPRLVFYQFPGTDSVDSGSNYRFTIPSGEILCQASALTPEAARQFVDDLTKKKVTLKCIFGLPGYSHKLNVATISYHDITKTATYKRLFGEGSRGEVSRHDVSKIAREAANLKQIFLRTEYEDSDFKALVDNLLSVAERREEEIADGWAGLDQKFLEKGWDPNSFKADLITRANLEMNNEYRNKFINDVEMKSKREGGGFSFGLFGANIFDVREHGNESLEFRKRVTRDVLRKWGIKFEEQGQRFVPKSIDVYINCQQKWSHQQSYMIGTMKVFATQAAMAVVIDPQRNIVDRPVSTTIQEELWQLRYNPPVGTIVAYVGTVDFSDPKKRKEWEERTGWMLCDGRNLRISEYKELFDAIGTAHGEPAEGQFNIPDLRGMFLRGANVNGGKDPDPERRPTAKVGSKQDFATARPRAGGNANILEKVHAYHQALKTIHGARAHYLVGHTAPAPPNNPPTVLVWDEETRPVNIAVHWIIKYRSR